MKGFARILEAIIASVIILAALTFFFVPQLKGSGWDSTSLQILSQDTLQTIYLNGSLTRHIKTDNRMPLISSIADMLPITVDFSIEVRGVPNSIIYVACAECSDDDQAELVKIINKTDFQYKDRNISIRLEKFKMSDLIPDDTNILFFFDKTSILAYKTEINGFVSNGGSVFLLSDLTQSDVENGIGKIFNLTWAGGSSQQGSFDDVYNSSKTSHFISKYYANTTGSDMQNVQQQTFQFNSNGVRLENDGKDVVIAGSVSYIRSNYNRTGRTLWFSDYNRVNHNNSQTAKIDSLAKASIMWASGERFKLDIVGKDPAPVHFMSSIFIFDGDSYIVDLTVWRVFF